MAKLTLGEERVEGDRFPGLVLTLDGKRYRISLNDASRFGMQLSDAAKSAVGRVDIDVLRELVAECEVKEIP